MRLVIGRTRGRFYEICQRSYSMKPSERIQELAFKEWGKGTDSDDLNQSPQMPEYINAIMIYLDEVYEADKIHREQMIKKYEEYKKI